MVAKARIGITGNAKRWSPSWWCLALAMRLAGAAPERISVARPHGGKVPDALIISGGDDISPAHYDEKSAGPRKIDLERDLLEIRWIERALDENIPMMGICRGAQLINVVMDGTLYQDIRPLRRRTSNRPSLLPTKRIRLAPGSRLARICGKPDLRVNSLHRQAVKSIGTGLVVAGRDSDEIIQAVESREKRVIGVQWHPEYLVYLPSQFALFRWLVNSAGNR